MSSRAGLKLVAALEGAKGVLVLAAGFGLFRLLHRDVQAAAEHLVRHLHLNPLGHFPRALIDFSASINDANLRLLVLLALAYSAVRLAEAYGLWTDRGWAEWFGAISGAIYLPLEIYKLCEKLTWTRFGFLTVNSAIVAYLVSVLVRRRQAARRARAPEGGVPGAP